MTANVSPDWLEEVLTAAWITPTIDAYLLADFDPIATTLADIPLIDRVAGPVTLSGKTVSGAYFSADTPEFTLSDGVEAAWFVAIVDTGVEATSTIVLATDERLGGAPLLVTGNGGIVELPFQSLGLGRI